MTSSLFRRLALYSFLLLMMSAAQAQVSVAREKPRLKSDPVPRSDTQAKPVEDKDAKEAKSDDDIPARQASKANTEESSSRDNIGDLSPPPNDNKRPDRDIDDSEDTGVSEFKPWNPHKAEKSTEVGEYYFKEKNYKAAISRYREALEYKPRDAHATYRLAEALEKSGQSAEALQRYEEYLKILKNGVFAEDAKKGVGRLKAKAGSVP